MTTASRTTTLDHDDKTAGISRLAGCELDAWLLRQPEPALVLFDAPWSAACRLERDVLVRLKGHFAGRVRVGALDAADSHQAPRRFRIGWVPTLILFDAGVEVTRWEGARGLSDLILDIEAALTRGLAPRASGNDAPVPSNRSTTTEVMPPAHRTKGGSS